MRWSLATSRIRRYCKQDSLILIFAMAHWCEHRVQNDGAQMPYVIDENTDVVAAKKRGLSYNDPNLTKNFGNKCVPQRLLFATVTVVALTIMSTGSHGHTTGVRPPVPCPSDTTTSRCCGASSRVSPTHGTRTRRRRSSRARRTCWGTCTPVGPHRSSLT